jgi:hypothetical protein
MKKNTWLIIIGVVAFVLMAPQDATNVVHNLTLFVQNVLSGFHMH